MSAGGIPPGHPRRAVGLWFLLLLVMFTGCGEQPKQRLLSRDGSDCLGLRARAAAFQPVPGTPGGCLTLATSTEPTTFNPCATQDALTLEIAGLTFEGLTRIDGVNGEPAAALAERWEASEGGRVWVFHLRRGVTWSDSVPFTSADVVFTYDTLVADSASPGWLRQRFAPAGTMHVSAVDSLTVRCELPRPYSLLPCLTTQPVLPRHRYRASARVHQFGRALGLRVAADSVVGSGPFLLATYVPSQRIALRRNPRYWRIDAAGMRLPYLDSLVYLIVPDENAKLVRLERGDIDAYPARGQDWAQLHREQPHKGYALYCLGPSRNSTALAFNLNRGADSAGAPFVDPARQAWFLNVGFRRAVAHALNRQAMVRMLLDSAGFVQDAAVMPADTALVPPRLSRWPYYVKQSRKLLAAAGFSDADSDRVIEDRTGAKVRFSILVSSGNALRRKIGERICQDLAAVGIAATLELVDYAAFVERLTKPPYGWEAALVSFQLPAEPLLASDVWRSSGSLHIWSPARSVPATPWELRIDSLLDAAAGQMDATSRRGTYRELNRVVDSELPLIFTVLPERIVYLSARFGNVNPSVSGGVLHNVEELFVKPAAASGTIAASHRPDTAAVDSLTVVKPSPR
jgi:peptide/nickel transport system substrate-binding protein